MLMAYTSTSFKLRTNIFCSKHRLSRAAELLTVRTTKKCSLPIIKQRAAPVKPDRRNGTHFPFYGYGSNNTNKAMGVASLYSFSFLQVSVIRIAKYHHFGNTTPPLEYQCEQPS